MPLGTPHDRTEVLQGDTAELRAYTYDINDVEVLSSEIVAADFTIKDPNGNSVTVVGDVGDDGSGFYRYEDTNVKGLYVWICRFTFLSGEKRSVRKQFNVYDPLEIPPQTRANQIAEEVWMRLEDCFDSDEGGPWLRDMTLSYFDPTKIERFVPEGLLEINIWPPMTNLELDFFTAYGVDLDPALPPNTPKADPDRYVIVLGTLLAVIKHLMRSYAEQPAPVGANIVYQDRRDYLQRWQAIYTLEEAEFRRVVALWKRQFLNLGHSSLLVHSKAGRQYGPGNAGNQWRLRNAGRGRGY